MKGVEFEVVDVGDVEQIREIAQRNRYNTDLLVIRCKENGWGAFFMPLDNKIYLYGRHFPEDILETATSHELVHIVVKSLLGFAASCQMDFLKTKPYPRPRKISLGSYTTQEAI